MFTVTLLYQITNVHIVLELGMLAGYIESIQLYTFWQFASSTKQSIIMTISSQCLELTADISYYAITNCKRYFVYIRKCAIIIGLKGIGFKT